MRSVPRRCARLAVRLLSIVIGTLSTGIGLRDTMVDNSFARAEARKNWERARSQATVQGILTVLRGGSPELLSFDEVQKSLRLAQKYYRGIQNIPLDQIRGSVGRYKDFTQSFLPKRSYMQGRWENVSMVVTTRGTPPIEVYQVGDAYFVLDGNHRVSIARQNEAETIEARVYEYATHVDLSADADIEEVLIKAEYLDFLEATELNKSHPEANIEFTVPGRYPELEQQIAAYRKVLEQIDEEQHSFQESASIWYELIYSPSVQIIQVQNALEQFPNRTEADLFIWVWRHNRELQEARGSGAQLTESVEEIAQPAPIQLSPIRKLWQFFKERLYAK